MSRPVFDDFDGETHYMDRDLHTSKDNDEHKTDIDKRSTHIKRDLSISNKT